MAGNDAFLGLFKEVDTLEKLERGGDLLEMLEYWEQRQERIQVKKPWAEEVERAMRSRGGCSTKHCLVLLSRGEGPDPYIHPHIKPVTSFIGMVFKV